MASGLLSVNGQIQNSRSRMFRRCFIKRRALGTGLYEDDWVEVTADVIKWNSIKKEVDASKVNSFKFSGAKLVFNNRDGKYNDSGDENSLWYQHGDQQRTLVKITAGFIYETQSADGIWHYIELPGSGLWDVAGYDSDQWDTQSILFNGFISGDVFLTGNDEVTLPVSPLTDVFRLYAAPRLSGLGPSLTAEGFINVLRDQVDADGAYIFRPFFGDTTGNWVVNSTSVNYPNLDTTTAEDVKDATAWDVIEKLATSENYVPFASNVGEFKFIDRNFGNTSPVYHFVGAGGYSPEYGHTIKKVSWFGKRFTKYYSRVRVQFREDDTTTSYAIQESTFRVSGSSSPWTLGERTLDVQNLWIPTLTAAETIASELFEEYSALRTEIEFTTSLVPHLDLLNRVMITYDPSGDSIQNLWDQYNWGDDLVPIGAEELLWDASKGDALKMIEREFRLISIDVNLDSGECKFIGRE